VAKANWNIVGTGSYGLSIDTPSGTGKSLQIVPVLYLLYNGKTNITNAEMVWWGKLKSTAVNAVLLRNQGLLNTNNCYLLICNVNTATLYRRVAGALTAMTTVAISFSNVWKKFRMRVKGYDFTLELWDGASWNLIMSATDTLSQFANGVSGIGGFYVSGDYIALFDDVEVGEEI
jgi:hypothetical protein